MERHQHRDRAAALVRPDAGLPGHGLSAGARATNPSGASAAAGPEAGRRVGERVFVAGARCFGPVRGLFGGAASRLVVPGARALPVGEELGERGVLLALAATAWHAMAAPGVAPPDLVVGHGVLGRLLARLAPLAGGAAPTVWETDARRATGSRDYRRARPGAGPAARLPRDLRRQRRRRRCSTGSSRGWRPAARWCWRGSTREPLRFAFPPAFMREARIRVAAEWREADLAAVSAFVADGRLSLDGLITHRRSAEQAPDAYRTAFGDPDCLKMVLDWRGTA